MKNTIITIISILTFSSLPAWSQESLCKLQNSYRIFVVGMDQGHPDRYPLASLMQKGALKSELILEVDSNVEMPTLIESENVKISENAFVRGFGISLAALWQIENRLYRHDLGFSPTILAPQLTDSVLNFANELTSNDDLKQVWMDTLKEQAATINAQAKAQSIALVLNQRKYASKLSFAVADRATLFALYTLIKPTVRKYYDLALKLKAQGTDMPMLAELSRLPEFLDFKSFKKTDKDYNILVRWYFMLGQQLTLKFNNEWRAQVMAWKIQKDLCQFEKTSPSNTVKSVVVLTELDSLVFLENFIKAAGNKDVKTSIEAPPRIGSELEKIINDYVVRFLN